VSSMSPRPDQERPIPAMDRATPSEQVASPLVGILKSADGSQSVTIRLQPAELGEVKIRVDRTIEGVAHVNVTADRPETLQLLQRDQPRLEQALDQAGVISDGRSFSFQTTAPEQFGASASRPDGMAGGLGDPDQGQRGGTWQHNGEPRREPGGEAGLDQRQTNARWFRLGLDITA